MTHRSEDGEIEVVVIVSDDDVSRSGDTDSDGIVGHSLSSDLTDELSLVREHLNEAWISSTVAGL